MTDHTLHILAATSGTVVTSNADEMIASYREGLDMLVISDGMVSSSLALAWGKPSLTGLRFVVLGANRTDPSTHWLRVIEHPTVVRPDPMKQRGWLALEVLVQDVHGLAHRLRNSHFSILGEPRPLAVSNCIVAMQVAGPAGETLYLTEVRGAVPPFRLPSPATHVAERLFIPVLSTPDRDIAMNFYERLNGNTGLRFETRVSALNSTLNIDLEQLRPVGTLQLAKTSLIEIDQVPEHSTATPQLDGLPGGLAMVSFAVAPDLQLPAGVHWRSHSNQSVCLLEGTAGEWTELVTD